MLFFLQFKSYNQSKGIIEGKIFNGSSNKLGKVDKISLYKLSMGMIEIKSIKNVSEKYRLENLEVTNNIPYLLQAVYSGVSYNYSLIFNENNIAKVDITVFEKSETNDKISVLLPHMIVKGIDNELVINKLFEIENKKEPKKVFYQNEETFKFFLPENLKKVNSVNISTGAISTNQNYKKTDENNVYSISYPIKPGKTQVEVSYSVDYSKNEYTFSEKILYDIDKLSILISPKDINVDSDKLSLKSENVEMNFKVYGVENLKRGDKLNFKIFGKSTQTAVLNSKNSETISGDKIISMHPVTNKFTFFIIVFLSIVLFFGVFLGRFISKRE
jgi:hypothetical protein